MTEYKGLTMAAIILFILGIGAPILALFIDWRISSEKLTGYIYSTEDFANTTTVHIRFSENAGGDEQPSFCVALKDRELAHSLAGSGKKVSVFVPSGFKFAPFWECGLPAEITILDTEEEK